eukprot:15437574-Alexandrium_andersonii.AAC.1
MGGPGHTSDSEVGVSGLIMTSGSPLVSPPVFSTGHGEGADDYAWRRLPALHPQGRGMGALPLSPRARARVR